MEVLISIKKNLTEGFHQGIFILENGVQINFSINDSELLKIRNKRFLSEIGENNSTKFESKFTRVD